MIKKMGVIYSDNCERYDTYIEQYLPECFEERKKQN